MNDLDLRLEVVSRSRQPLRYILRATKPFVKVLLTWRWNSRMSAKL